MHRVYFAICLIWIVSFIVKLADNRFIQSACENVKCKAILVFDSWKEFAIHIGYTRKCHNWCFSGIGVYVCVRAHLFDFFVPFYFIGYAAYWRFVGTTLLRFGLLIKLFFWQFHFQCGALPEINDLYKDTLTHLRMARKQANILHGFILSTKIDCYGYKFGL